MSSHFSIVQFPGSERTNEVEVEIVPTSWINLETKSVLWPPSTVTGAALKKLQKTAKDPCTSWKEFPFTKVLGCYGK
jgi:hypothetical protein